MDRSSSSRLNRVAGEGTETTRGAAAGVGGDASCGCIICCIILNCIIIHIGISGSGGAAASAVEEEEEEEEAEEASVERVGWRPCGHVAGKVLTSLSWRALLAASWAGGANKGM